MIQHIVMLSLRDDVQPATLQEVMVGLADLQDKIDGFTGFAHGPNRDFEEKSQDYPYGFIATFADVGALNAYAADPDHAMLGARLVAMCHNGADGIMVMDLALS